MPLRRITVMILSWGDARWGEGGKGGRGGGLTAVFQGDSINGVAAVELAGLLYHLCIPRQASSDDGSHMRVLIRTINPQLEAAGRRCCGHDGKCTTRGETDDDG